MKTRLFIMGLLTIAVSACQNNSQTEEQKEPEKIPGNQMHEKTQHQMHAEPVLLNNGEKWKANPETSAGIRNMVRLTTDFPKGMPSANYDSLGIKLDTEFNGIFQKCTMTGEAHIQLHNYLHPMKQMIRDLNSQDTSICRQAFDDLKTHLAEYDNYFQ